MRRIVEAHHAEPGEHGVHAPGGQIQALGIHLDQPRLAEPLRPPPGDLKEQQGHVHPENLPFGSDPLGQLG